MNGRDLGTIHKGIFDTGIHTISISNTFNYISSGTYFLILESRGRKAATKITISR
jgi:hypothetical protein